jgi:uncharacterized protein
MDTRAAVEELLNRIGCGDPERIADMYAEHVDWQLNWPEDEHGGPVPWIRQRATRADVERHYGDIAAHHVTGRAAAQIAEVLVDGESAVVTGTLTNVVSRTGKRYDARFALHLKVAEGRITSHHVYEDSLAVSRAWHP